MSRPSSITLSLLLLGLTNSLCTFSTRGQLLNCFMQYAIQNEIAQNWLSTNWRTCYCAVKVMLGNDRVNTLCQTRQGWSTKPKCFRCWTQLKLTDMIFFADLPWDGFLPVQRKRNSLMGWRQSVINHDLVVYYWFVVWWNTILLSYYVELPFSLCGG